MTQASPLPAWRRLPRAAAMSGLALLTVLLSACSALDRLDSTITGAGAAPASGTRPTIVVSGTPHNGQEFYRFKYGYVRFEAAEPGGRSELPVALDESALRAALQELRGAGKPLGNRPLFAEDELAELAPVLRDALAQAAPGQDVVFASTGKHGGLSLLETESVNAARVFVSQGTLQVIFGMTQVNFGDQLRGQGSLKTFLPGERSHPLSGASPVQGASWQPVDSARSDWLSVPLAALRTAPRPAAASAAVPAAAPASGLTASAPALATDARPATTAAAPRVGSAADPDEGERRLATLERLRQKGLITQQEYDTRHKAIVDGL